MILIIAILFISIVLHEYAHGWVAHKLGDPTPKEAGRLTLNPIKHIDLFGTILLPFLLLKISSGRFSFGYAKPVPINPYHFKNPRKDILWVGLAGPLVNFTIANLLLMLFKIFPYGFFSEVLLEGAIINLILTVFNLVPIPPLDGSRVVAAMLPYKFSMAYLKAGLIGSFLIFSLILVGFSKWFIMPVVIKIISLWGITVTV